MSGIVNTEWSGYHFGKDALRSKIWTQMDEQNVSPVSPFGHIPTFVGAEEAAARLATLPIWQRAKIIKFNPDTAYIPLRLRALQDGKRIYMAVPRLTEERCFVELTAEALKQKGVTLKEAAPWQGAMTHGQLVSPGDMKPIDLVLVGCVAVSSRGGRIGKGAGFADLELGILRELGLLKPETPIVAAVHPVQIVDESLLPMMPHDSPLDWIVTPSDVIETESDYPRPSGLDWGQIRDEQFENIPVLSLLREQLQDKKLDS
jgi:5-formyltetrahydrofolate cyclo-ligase